MNKFKDLILKDSVSYTISEPIYTSDNEREITSPYLNVSIQLSVLLKPDVYSITENKFKEIMYCIQGERNFEDLITVRHYAEKHNLSKETVRKRIQRGKIPYVLVDGVYFIIEE